MPSYGPRSPTTQTQTDPGSAITWVNPGNVFVSDNIYATCATGVTAFSWWLNPAGYGFTIPAGETVTSVVVEVEGNVTGGIGVQWWIAIQATGAGFDPLEFKNVLIPGAEAFAGVTFDAAGFNTLPSRAQANDASFGARVYAETIGGAADAVRIDYIRITITTAVGNNQTKRGLLRVGF